MKTGLSAMSVALLVLGLGAGTQEKPKIALTGVVVDAVTDRPLPARVYVQGGDGAWHFPRSKDGSAIAYKKQRADNPRSAEMHTSLSAHPFAVDLPAGKYTITVERGHEYLPLTQTVELDGRTRHVTLKLRRWIDMAAHGWHSGETHVHRPLDELPHLMLAEDL